MAHSTTRKSFAPALAMTVAVLGSLTLLVMAPFHIADQAATVAKAAEVKQAATAEGTSSSSH